MQANASQFEEKLLTAKVAKNIRKGRREDSGDAC